MPYQYDNPILYENKQEASDKQCIRTDMTVRTPLALIVFKYPFVNKLVNKFTMAIKQSQNNTISMELIN